MKIEDEYEFDVIRTKLNLLASKNPDLAKELLKCLAHLLIEIDDERKCEEILDYLRNVELRTRKIDVRSGKPRDVLPGASMRTLEVVKSRGKVTIEEVSKITGRPKNLESAYLAALHRHGFIARIKEGKTVYYMTKEEAVKEAIKRLGSGGMPTIEEIYAYTNISVDDIKEILKKIKHAKQ